MIRQRINIVHLITSLNPGGSESMLLRLLSQMDHKRFENSVIALIPIGAIGEKLAALDIPVISLEMTPGKIDLGAIFRLTNSLRRIRPDILQTWLYHADLLGLVAARISGVPHVVWNVRSADMDMRNYNALSGITRRVCASLSPWPDAVIVNSRSGQAFHTGIGYHPQKWVLLPNGIPIQKFIPDASARQSVRMELDLAEGAPITGSFGRYDETKDFPNLIAAAGMLKEQGSDFRLLLAGNKVDSGNAELVQLIKKHGLHENIRLLGHREDIPRLASALDIYISASYTEGFPNSIAEAMSCAVPCVATSAGDSAEIIGDTGFVVPRRDARALSMAWGKMLNMPAAERRALGQLAQERIQNVYSIQAVSRSYEAFYEGLLTQDPN